MMATGISRYALKQKLNAERLRISKEYGVRQSDLAALFQAFLRKSSSPPATKIEEIMAHLAWLSDYEKRFLKTGLVNPARMATVPFVPSNLNPGRSTP